LSRDAAAHRRTAARGTARVVAMTGLTLGDLTFDYVWLLPLAIVLPLLAFVVLRHSYRERKRRLERLGNMEVVSRLIPPNTLVPPGWRIARLCAASALVGIAVAGPRWGEERGVVRS